MDKERGDVPSPNFQYQYSGKRTDWGAGGWGEQERERREGYGGYEGGGWRVEGGGRRESRNGYVEDTLAMRF